MPPEAGIRQIVRKAGIVGCVSRQWKHEHFEDARSHCTRALRSFVSARIAQAGIFQFEVVVPDLSIVMC